MINTKVKNPWKIIGKFEDLAEKARKNGNQQEMIFYRNKAQAAWRELIYAEYVHKKQLDQAKSRLKFRSA